LSDADTLISLETLVSPFGVVAGVRYCPQIRGLTELSVYSAFYGKRLPAQESVPSAHPKQIARPHGSIIPGAGAGVGRTFGDADRARLIAIAEAAERYSGAGLGLKPRLASQRQLGDQALDLARIPRCSRTELSRPDCPLHYPDPSATIRWVAGVDLCTSALIWVPEIMAAYGTASTYEGEKFWYRISTGFAVHTDPVEALVRGICEVVERDTIAVSWLQRLRLPTIAEDQFTGRTARFVESSRRHFVDTYLFDATSDIGVPTVLCLQVAPYDTCAAQLLGCSTGRDIQSACEGAILEASAIRQYFHDLAKLDPDCLDESHISHGARYMAAPDKSVAFEFLTADARDRLSSVHEPMPRDSGEALGWLVSRLSSAGMQVIALDLTTEELRAAGLTAVNVIIPDLQPMSLMPKAQYRGHPRLYTSPTLRGFRSLAEEELNPWPIPFA
jgi:ribosomal protein S12 methylthiotransferase accessory factor